MPKYDLSDKNKFPENPGILNLKPEPDDRSQLGELIISLALGLKPIPGSTATQGEKRALMLAAGVVIPPGVDVEFYERKPNTLVVMIPPRDMVVAALRRYQAMDENGEPYDDLPWEYKDMAKGVWQKSIEEFYEVRVADYTLSYCR